MYMYILTHPYPPSYSPFLPTHLHAHRCTRTSLTHLRTYLFACLPTYLPARRCAWASLTHLGSSRTQDVVCRLLNEGCRKQAVGCRL